VAGLNPIYLIHGDDDAKVGEWRTRLRRRAEAELGPGGLESFDPRADPPEAVAASLATLTFATGTRYLLADDVTAWKAGDLPPLLEAMAAMPPDTVLVLIARGKPLKALLTAVQKAGGEVREHAAPKPWEMGRWVTERGKDIGLRVEAEAAKALLAIVGAGQQRLVRELEKLAIAIHPDTTLRVEQVEEMAGGETPPRVYDLADAVVAGDLEAAVSFTEELAANDERPGRLIYPIVNRLREVHRVVELLDSGVGEKDLPKAMGVPPWRVKKSVALARRSDRETLERALCRFADLELDLRSPGGLDDETAMTLTLARAAA
jgi:DNA polymerase III subunit delta